MFTMAAERAGFTETVAPLHPIATQTSTAAVRADDDPSNAGQHLPLPAHHGAAATQPSATCGLASRPSAPRAGTTSRLITHQHAGAMCSFDIVSEVRTATFICITH